jgi:hypothetical protein
MLFYFRFIFVFVFSTSLFASNVVNTSLDLDVISTTLDSEISSAFDTCNPNHPSIFVGADDECLALVPKNWSLGDSAQIITDFTFKDETAYPDSNKYKYCNYLAKKHYSCLFECIETPKPANMGIAHFDKDKCEWVPECSDKVPADWLPYPMIGGECKPFAQLTSLEKETFSTPGGLVCSACYAPPYDEHTCLPPKILDYSISNVPLCVTPPDTNSTTPSVPGSCTPLSNGPTSLSYSQCVNGAFSSDYNLGMSGTLSWQMCDNICYILEPVAIPCKIIGKKLLGVCDRDLNNFTFNCTQQLQPGGSPDISKAPVFTSSCKPKNQEKIKTPCTSEKIKKQEECKALGQKIIGDCTDNGIVITSNTLDCDIIKPDCSAEWNEVYNVSTNKCDCETGYIKTILGDCRTPFPWELDSNLTDKQKATITSADTDLHDAKTNNDTSKISNDKLDALGLSVKTTNNILAGVRSDLNTTNHKLSSIGSKIDSLISGTPVTSSAIDSSDLDKYLAFVKSVTKEYSTFSTNVKSQLADITTQFKTAKGTFSSSHTFSKFSTGVSPSNNLSIMLFGHIIKITLCPYFRLFAPFIYFMLVGYFMVQVFFFTLNNLLRSFN